MASIAEQRRRVRDLIATLEPELQAAFVSSVDDIRNNIVLAELILALEAGNVEQALEVLHISRASFGQLADVFALAFNQGGRLQTEFLPRLTQPNGLRAVVQWDVRNLRAEAVLAELSSSLITQVTEETIKAARVAITEGYAAGQGPSQIALSLAGRINRASNRREGGLVGMSAPQAEAATNMRERLLSGDPAEMRKVLDMKLRDKRFDASIRKAIDAEKPLSQADADKMVARYADKAIRMRGEMIARTETGNAVMAARHAAVWQAIEARGATELDVKRRWRAVGDDKTRHTHRGMNRQTVIGMSQAFVSPSGARLMYPLDRSLGAPASEVVACRCDEDIIFDFTRGLK
ncbi:head morphogenesis protein [Asticcacaulis endophyticus]|uniref:Phage Mu protein F like protein n=1 Tax=Asticcacaulis endophyticus TaxID=1395890 RepID=A0A918PSV7_9CAUL|nr:head morphogenesis protein [Asticcacaulis endophyticus]GGZ21745.1 hypothetical protein GCM10011273_03160 [Asticcacaulis endophyticus]